MTARFLKIGIEIVPNPEHSDIFVIFLSDKNILCCRHTPLLHDLKPALPIRCNPFGNSTSVNSEQPLNAESPISVRVLGKLIFLIFSLSLKALSQIVVTPSGIAREADVAFHW